MIPCPHRTAFFRAKDYLSAQGRTAALCWVLLLSLSSASPALQAGETLAPDVRVLIDISGSMKLNDPGNLRAPALNLLVELLPGQSRAGVWTFGREVNMLVPHGEVDRAWRERAQRRAAGINAVALRSNIGGVLEQANYDRDPRRFPASASYNKSVILLTDGVVDIARDAQANQRERARILASILPQYQAAGVRIHTIALSGDADTELLKALSEATDGVFAIAETAADLNKVFLRALDQAAAADQVPLEDNAFLIDASVEEFTALIFKRAGAEPTHLTSPGGERISATRSSNGVRWLSDANYDLVTVAAPLAGEWRISAALDPDNRVTVVSNLQLSIAALPATLYSDETHALQLELLDDGEPVIDARFLQLLTVQAGLARGEVDIWQQTLRPDREKTHSYRRELDMLDEPGSHTLEVLVDGKTFKRQRQLTFTLKLPFRSELVIDKARAEYALTVVAAKPSYINAGTRVYANIVDPLDELEMVELTAVAPGVWTYAGAGALNGAHRISVFTHAQPASATTLTIAMHDITLSLAGAAAAPVAVQPQLAAVEPAPDTPVAPEPESESKPLADTQPQATAALVEPTNNRWMVYAGLAVGNLLMIAALVLVYRKITAPGEVEVEGGAEAEADGQSDGGMVEDEVLAAVDPAGLDAEPAAGVEVELAVEQEEEREEGSEIELSVTPALASAPEETIAAAEDEPEAEMEVAVSRMTDGDKSDAGIAAELAADLADEKPPAEAAHAEAGLDAVLAELDKTLAASGAADIEQAVGAAPAQAATDSESDSLLDLDDEFDLSSDISDASTKRSDAV